MKYFMFSKTIPNKSIDFLKLGIKFRKMNDDELNEVYKIIKFTLNSSEFKNVYKLYLDYKNIENDEREELLAKKIELLNIITNLERNMGLFIFFKYSYYEQNIKINKKLIFDRLEEVLIVEIDDNSFCKNFDIGAAGFISSKIMRFADYINFDTKNLASRKIDFLNYDYFSKTNKYEVAMYVLDSKKNYYQTINLNSLKLISSALNKKPIDFNFSFISLIEMAINDESLIENKLVNKVFILERLLVRKEENQSKAFVLKTGILCKNIFTNLDNNTISKQLNAIYEIRSNIVHGDDYKNLLNIDKYKEIFPIEDIINSSDSKYLKRALFLVTINTIIEIYLIEILNNYLANPEYIEYLKGN